MKSEPLHITDGESVAGTLRKSGLPGVVIVDGDLLYEASPASVSVRPAPAVLTLFAKHTETILWFDHRLSNQLLLIRGLDWFSQQDLSGHRLSIIFAGKTELGGLTADRLASLAPTRVPATAAHFEVARAAWGAFTSPRPLRDRARSRHGHLGSAVSGPRPAPLPGGISLDRRRPVENAAPGADCPARTGSPAARTTLFCSSAAGGDPLHGRPVPLRYP